MYSESELAPRSEDLKRALGDTFDKEKIKEELMKYFEYGIELSEAKKAVVKKLGGDPNKLFAGVTRKLSEVLPSDSNIDLKVKIISVNEKTVTVQGNEKVIYYGLLADSAMVRPFTAWNDFKLSKGDVVQIHSAYAKDWRGEPQINLGNNTTVASLDDSELAGLNSTNLPSSLPSTDHKIGSLKSGLSNVTVTGRVLTVEPRTVTANEETKEIFTGILADETGRVAFTAWSNFKLKESEVIKVSGAYIRSWRGVPKLNFDERMDLQRLPDDTLPSIDELGVEQRIKIADILEVGGGMDITVEGSVLDIKEGSGLIIRCPECKRVLRGGECMIHGAQDGVSDLRIKAIVDDGSGAIMAVFNSELTSKLIGKTLDECETETKDKGPDNIKSIQEEINDILLMNPLRVKGTITIDDYGAMMICTNAELLIASEEINAKATELINSVSKYNWQQEVD